MSTSAVVPTRNRPAALRRCLTSLRDQGLELDVIVVDDGSVAAATVEDVVGELGARLVRTAGRGPAAARNAGIAVARGDHVLLIDDDCVALPGWAETLVAAVGGSDRLVVAGTVSVIPAASTWTRASELLAADAEHAIGFFRTNNLCARRELLLEIPFDERFRAAAGEDRDWCARAARAGVSFERVAISGVEHRVELGPRTFLAQQARYGRAVRVLRTSGTHVPMSARAQWRGLSSGFADDPAVGLVMLVAHAAATVGYLAEWMTRRAR